MCEIKLGDVEPERVATEAGGQCLAGTARGGLGRRLGAAVVGGDLAEFVRQERIEAAVPRMTMPGASTVDREDDTRGRHVPVGCRGGGALEDPLLGDPGATSEGVWRLQASEQLEVVVSEGLTRDARSEGAAGVAAETVCDDKEEVRRGGSDDDEAVFLGITSADARRQRNIECQILDIDTLYRERLCGCVSMDFTHASTIEHPRIGRRYLGAATNPSSYRPGYARRLRIEAGCRVVALVAYEVAEVDQPLFCGNEERRFEPKHTSIRRAGEGRRRVWAPYGRAGKAANCVIQDPAMKQKGFRLSACVAHYDARARDTGPERAALAVSGSLARRRRA
jgi:hypothetical protein